MTSEAGLFKVSAFMRDLPSLHDTEKPVSFDPVQTTFLQKLVRASALQEGVTVKKEEFFAAIACVDYFTEVVAARDTIVADIAVVVEELDKMADYLDPDLELLTRYLGVYIAKDLKDLFKPGSLSALERRHDRGNTTVASAAGEVDLYHQAVGRFVAHQVHRPEVLAFLDGAKGRNDVRAALLCDAILKALPDARFSPSEGKIVPALIDLLRGLSQAAPSWSLREHVERLKAQL